MQHSLYIFIRTHNNNSNTIVLIIFQAIFASSIPEIIELVGNRSKYSGEYKREHGKRYTKYDKYIFLKTLLTRLRLKPKLYLSPVYNAR